MSQSRFIGGILLIVGTSIGAGMLALPVVNAASGFWLSTLSLLGCWLLMTAGAFYILEVNLYLPPGKDMISMAEATLGQKGLVVAWVTYLFLLYALLSAYISGGADVLGGALHQIAIDVSPRALAVCFVFFFGLVVYRGIRQVDLMNRVLMFVKLGVFVLLVFCIAPYMQRAPLSTMHVSAIAGTLMVLATSFGYAIIVPNLRVYFNDDVAALKRVIWIGSFIPLVCYVIWDAVIIGSLPLEGVRGLLALNESAHTTSLLALTLEDTVHYPVISVFFRLFTGVSMLTAFLGVSLCLFSFLADGFNLTCKGRQGWLLFTLTFFPSLTLVMYYPGAYLYALHYAGYCCVVLLMFLPAWMSWCGRKRHRPSFIVPGGRFSQGLVMLAAVGLLAVSLY